MKNKFKTPNKAMRLIWLQPLQTNRPGRIFRLVGGELDNH
jgi:hypothetical protein